MRLPLSTSNQLTDFVLFIKRDAQSEVLDCVGWDFAAEWGLYKYLKRSF
jgi:hypothetical protein